MNHDDDLREAHVFPDDEQTEAQTDLLQAAKIAVELLDKATSVAGVEITVHHVSLDSLDSTWEFKVIGESTGKFMVAKKTVGQITVTAFIGV